MRIVLSLILCLTFVPIAAAQTAPITLFDFESADEVAAFSNLQLPKVENPAIKIESSAEHASSGKQSLKLTFGGGEWPTVTTTKVPSDWMPFETFTATVTVSRDCVIGFQALQEGSKRGGDWDGAISRWVKTDILRPGTHEICAPIHHSNDYSINKKLGPVVRFEIFAYSPHEGETIYVDNIRLSAEKPKAAPPAPQEFKVAGTDLVVTGVADLGKRLKEKWQRPQEKTLDQVEAGFRAAFKTLKEKHPRAQLATFRDGEAGFDPAQPEKVYAGWKDAYWSSHGPDGMAPERAQNIGDRASHEVFMRHRSPLMRVDLATIPTGSQILAAHLIVIRGSQPVKEHNPDQPNMWVVESCNRPWNEYEVNAYRYAKDKYWRAIGGMYYGDDPDFLPVYLAHGPSQGKVNVWDFGEAVAFWTDGKHENHGFMLHGNAGDWFGQSPTREAKTIHDRPAVLVIYEPPAK